MNTECPYVLVTAGGTSVNLDGVRILTNRSKGGFGVAIASAVVQRKYRVVLVCTEVTKQMHTIPRSVEVVIYDTFDQYVAAITRIVQTYGSPHMAFSAAAVSDATVAEPIQGKMRINGAFSIPMKPLPKVLNTWRELMGRRCFLVGFKLLDHDSSLEELLSVARKQNHRDKLNLTVANFKPWNSSDDQRKIWLVKPDGGHLRCEGSLAQNAQALVDFAIRQANTSWAKSEYKGDQSAFSSQMEECRDRQLWAIQHSACLLDFAQRSGLLVGSPGNIALVNRRPYFFIVTPRGRTNKEQLHADDLVYATFTRRTDTITYWGQNHGAKPSIDTHVYARVFDSAPMYNAAIHFHDGWVLDAISTRLDYPCGSAEEAEMVIDALARSATLQGDTPSPWTIVELVRHGHSLFVRDTDALFKLFTDYGDLYAQYALHLRDVGQEARVDELRIQPIFGRRGAIVGVAAEHREEGWYSIFLDPAQRGHGYGEEVVQRLNERGLRVGVHNDCRAETFYRSHGFVVVERRENGLIILEPPSRASLKPIPCATVTIRDASTGRYLQIRRKKTGTFPGLWCNPGGQVDGEETRWQTAIRETCEEVTYHLDNVPEPDEDHRSHQLVVHLAEDASKDRRFDVVSYHIDVPHTVDTFYFEPDEVEEVRWMTALEIKASNEHGRGTKNAVRAHEARIRREQRLAQLALLS